ncbi:Plasmid stabilization protein OS=Streptomyces canus OX=58343 GN=AQJ46_29670 PE=4 SV=1 [Streptomyces canus]
MRGDYVAPGVMLEYVVAGAIMVVVVVWLFDESQYLFDETDAQ